MSPTPQSFSPTPLSPQTHSPYLSSDQTELPISAQTDFPYLYHKEDPIGKSDTSPFKGLYFVYAYTLNLLLPLITTLTYHCMHYSINTIIFNLMSLLLIVKY